MTREHYHLMLDKAFDNTKEGDSFLPEFVALIIKELSESKVSQ
jgi:hypothetical protein